MLTLTFQLGFKRSRYPGLELQTQAGAYLAPSEFLLSRITGDCACPVGDRERPAFG